MQVGRDGRRVMRAAEECFRTGAAPSAILAAAGGDEQGHDAFYSRLYVGLWHEAQGEAAAAREAIVEVGRPGAVGCCLECCGKDPAVRSLGVRGATLTDTLPLPCASLPYHQTRQCARPTASRAEITWLRWRRCTASGGAGRREAASLPSLCDASPSFLPHLTPLAVVAPSLRL